MTNEDENLPPNNARDDVTKPLLMCTECLRTSDDPDHPMIFSRNQARNVAPETRKCTTCITRLERERIHDQAQAQTKQCGQCYQLMPRRDFSTRQYQHVLGKCRRCITALHSQKLRHATWTYDCYYRSCRKSTKHGGAAIRKSNLISAPVVSRIPFGRVIQATSAMSNAQGDWFVKIILDDHHVPAHLSQAWVACRSIDNEVVLEPVEGPFCLEVNHENSKFRKFPPLESKSKLKPPVYVQCVIEGCKVRSRPDLELEPMEYLEYGDVVQVLERMITPSGLVFYRVLAPRQKREPEEEREEVIEQAWVLERTLDNESVLVMLDNRPFTRQSKRFFRCVLPDGAPLRAQPSLATSPIHRLPCGQLVEIQSRVVNVDRQVFLQLAENQMWVIERTTCCASVMIEVHQDKAWPQGLPYQ